MTMCPELDKIDWRLAGIADAVGEGQSLPEDTRRLQAWVNETARRIRLFPNATGLADDWASRHSSSTPQLMIAELQRLWPLLSAQVAETRQPYRWDIFVAHAARDIQFVRALCRALRAYHLRVWIDRDELTVGDSFRRTIDAALSECRYSVVVFSPNSIGRTWLHRELDALTQLETTDRKVVLPLLHNLTPAQLQETSVLLSGRLALSTSEHPIKRLAYEIARAVAIG